MHYKIYSLQEDIVVQSLITFCYMELSRQFTASAEHHNFWELVYVDKGKIEIDTDINRYELDQGNIVFYKPNEFHAGWAIKNTAPNLVVISFECTSPCMSFFEDKLIHLDEDERMILSRLIEEGKES